MKLNSEAKEECGLEIHELKNVGYLEFQFEDKMNETREVHVFCADKYSGVIRECEGNIFREYFFILFDV
jgi:ADP-ribose pyrophosphatase YjhB (NUDIX family)